MNLSNEQIKKIEIDILDALEGDWILDTFNDKERQVITFAKPMPDNVWGVITIWETPLVYISNHVQYRLLIINEGKDIFLDIMVNTSGQINQYALSIDYLNSYAGKMYLTDHLGHKLNYNRLTPRIQESES